VTVGEFVRSRPESTRLRRAAGEAEVQHLDLARGRELDVPGLEVAVNDARLVGGLERARDLPADLERLVDRQGAAPQALGQGLALDELEHEEAAAVRFLEPVDPGDVRVGEGGEQPRLALEAREAFGIGRKRIGQHLDRHRASEARVFAAVDDTHAAAADFAFDGIGADAIGEHGRALYGAEPDAASPRRRPAGSTGLNRASARVAGGAGAAP
jgi:hypothetical protein